jgi:GNAT superfamily N-acetyltransferase
MANALELLRTIKLLWFSLTWPRYKFRLPKRTLPTVSIRPFKQADLEICCDIYKLNAPGLFPEGYYDIFRGAITSPNTLFLVVENEGTVLGLAGISLSLLETYQEAKLSYGMIHPDAHRKGIGTALLLARISALPEPDKPYVLLCHHCHTLDHSSNSLASALLIITTIPGPIKNLSSWHFE